MPAEALTWSLDFRDDSHEVTGANPLVAAVSAMLSAEGLSGLLERRWQVTGEAADKVLSAPLQQLLSQGSLLALVDHLRGNGVLLEPMPGTRVPFWTRRPKILLRAGRQGQYTQSDTFTATLSKGRFRLTGNEVGSQASEGHEWTFGLGYHTNPHGNQFAGTEFGLPSGRASPWVPPRCTGGAVRRCAGRGTRCAPTARRTCSTARGSRSPRR